MQRKTDTRNQIKETFTKLLKEKGLDSLTVSDIARGAGINRGTFYLHYLDKYDLMNQLEDVAINELTDILLNNVDEKLLDDPIEIIPYHSILEALKYVKSDFDFIEALAGPGGDPQFIQKIKMILENLVKAMIKKSKKLEFSKKGLPQDYANEILLSSITSIILLWIKKGAKESPEEIARMISQAKQISPYELLL